MAGRGGYQAPAKPAPASGPGKLSKRTDGPGGSQPIRTPNVTDPESSLQVGDRQTLEAAQRLAPLPRGHSPGVAPGSSRKPPSSAVEGAGGSNPLTSEFFSQDSARPNEPVTAGMDMGAGPGSEALRTPQTDDVRELVLNYLATNYANADALSALDEIRGVASQSPYGNQTASGGPPALEVSGPGGADDFDDDFDALADSGDLLDSEGAGDSLEEDFVPEEAVEATESDEEPLEETELSEPLPEGSEAPPATEEAPVEPVATEGEPE